MGGIEPPTSVLSGLRSTTELHAQNFLRGQACSPLARQRSTTELVAQIFTTGYH